MNRFIYCVEFDETSSCRNNRSSSYHYVYMNTNLYDLVCDFSRVLTSDIDVLKFYKFVKSQFNKGIKSFNFCRILNEYTNHIVRGKFEVVICTKE